MFLKRDTKDMLIDAAVVILSVLVVLMICYVLRPLTVAAQDIPPSQVVIECGEQENILALLNPIDEVYYTSATNGLHLRNSMDKDTKDNIINTISYGEKIQLLAILDNGWDVIKYKNQVGYCWSEYVVKTMPASAVSEMIYSAADLRSRGVIYWGDWRWTWYSQKVLPGGGLNIPGRHVDANGYVCDGDGYICLASSVLSKGTVVSTPFGKAGKVYDSGCAANTLDVYTNF